MDRTTFAQRALEHMRTTYPGAAPVLDEADFAIVVVAPDGSRIKTSLGTYYPAFAAGGPAEQSAIVASVARASQVPERTRSFEEARPRLLPRVRARRFFDYDSAKAAAPETWTGCHRAVLGEHLGVGIAIDHPEHVEYVSDPLVRFGVPGTALEAIALENLRRKTLTGLVEHRPGLWVGDWNDDHAPSRMLFPELFASVGPRGAPVVFLPGSERIVVGSEGDPATLAYLADAAAQRMKGPQSLVGFPFVLRHDGWHRFDPGGELGLRFSTMLARHLASAYQMQREMLLDGRLAWRREGELPYVGSVLQPFKNNPELTMSTWSEGTDALVPQTELVAVAKPDGRKAVVPWPAFVAATAGFVGQAPDLYPPRWWARGVVDEGVFGELLRHDIGGNGANSLPAKPSTRPPPPPVSVFRGRALSVTQSGDLLAFRPTGGRDFPSLPGTKTLYLPGATVASASLQRSFVGAGGEVSLLLGAASLALVGDFRRVDRPNVVEVGPLPEAEAEALLAALSSKLGLPRQPRPAAATDLLGIESVDLVVVEAFYEPGHRDAPSFAGASLRGPRTAALAAGARYRLVGFAHPPPAPGPPRARGWPELYVLAEERLD